ncbi:hypothetical protein MTO96_045187, partial [Rhipicephalus appendiculatus]
MDSSDPDSKRPDSQTRASSAASPAQQQHQRQANLARKTAARTLRGAQKAAASNDSKKREKKKDVDAVKACQPDSEEGCADHEKEQETEASKNDERATTNRGSKAASLAT